MGDMEKGRGRQMLGMGSGARMEAEERSTKVSHDAGHGTSATWTHTTESIWWSCDLSTVPVVSHPLTLNCMNSS